MVIINIVIALLVFCIIVLVHEFGHFIVAKKNGILVEEFAIGMGPKLISKKVGDTLYSIRIFPIGGYCRMLGEEEDDNQEGSFSTKSVGARMAVIFAGPFMNFLLAFIIFIGFASTIGYSTLTIDNIEKDYPAYEAGLKVGDTIKKVNNKTVHIFEDIPFNLYNNKDKEISILVDRDGEDKEFSLKPKLDKERNAWRIGFGSKRSKGNILGILNNSFWKIIYNIKAAIMGFTQFITMRISPDKVMGPIGIVTQIGEAYEQGMNIGFKAAILNLLSWVAMLSANLGALNLFPIPALDGSKLVFLVIEKIRRKPIKASIENTVHLVGFALLILLMIYVAYNDIMRLF